MKKTSVQKPLRVGMISLGCAKNLVDAEIMLGSLLAQGLELTNHAEEADALIVNTCSFIDAAQEESVNTILESDQVREANHRGQALIVAGCLPQRFREELPKLLPEVDAFMGIDQVAQVPEIVRQAMAARQKKTGELRHAGNSTNQRSAAKVKKLDPKRQEAKSAIARSLATLDQELPPASPTPTTAPLVEVNLRPQYIPDYATPRFRLTPRHFAYVKIAEGCNHPCSFCIIPRMRGTHRSRPQKDILAEAKALLADGVKELNLISQDSTYYGLDLRPQPSRAISAPARFSAAIKALPTEVPTICTLLRQLNALPGEFWIRLLYTHPAHWTDDLIQTIQECPKVARYVDIPLQHIHQNMLERMRRETSQEYIVELLRRIRHGVPGITLRTTFIVGFPGETEEYFESLLHFIRETRFERLGVFAYSQEEGTRAGKMAGQIPDKIKRHRRNRAMAVQHEIAVAVSESYVGREIRVLVEKEASASELRAARISSWEHGLIRSRDQQLEALHGRYLVARAETDAPDIDGRVYVRGRLPVGSFAHVKIVGHTDYDLVAKPV